MRYLPIVLLIAACGGDGAPASHDAAVVPDASPDAYVCTDRDLRAMLVEDTFLPEALCGGPMREGEATSLELGESGSSRVLLRFELTPDILDALADGTATGGTLTVTLRPDDCPCTNAPTSFDVFAATDGWNEGTATGSTGADWCFRIGLGSNLQTPWQESGANGPNDRSQVVLASHDVTSTDLATPGTVTVPFTLDASLRGELMAQVAENRLSLALVPTAGGTLFLHSRESLVSATTLSFHECR